MQPCDHFPDKYPQEIKENMLTGRRGFGFFSIKTVLFTPKFTFYSVMWRKKHQKSIILKDLFVFKQQFQASFPIFEEGISLPSVHLLLTLVISTSKFHVQKLRATNKERQPPENNFVLCHKPCSGPLSHSLQCELTAGNEERAAGQAIKGITLI